MFKTPFTTLKPFAHCQTKESLAARIGISIDQIDYFAHASSDKLYNVFAIQKKNGNYRRIYNPIDGLKYAQLSLKEALIQYYKKPSCVLGMEKGTSVVMNASKHVKKDYVVNFDIKDFYESIHIGRIIAMLKKLTGLDKELSTVVAQLLTCNKVLPTGAPTSPLVADMIFYRADYMILKYIENKDIRYTRYADDITFSFKDKKYLDLFFDNTSTKTINKAFESIFEKNGFKLNNEKIRIQTKNMHQEVTGIKVNNELNLSRRYYSNLRYQLRCANKYGLKNYLEKLTGNASADKTIDKWKKKIEGKISYYGMVRGKDNSRYKHLCSLYNSCINARRETIFVTNFEEARDKGTLFINAVDNDIGGTAFYYKGYIITCNHCVDYMMHDDDTYLFIDNPITRRTLKATLIFKDRIKDIAVFKPENKCFYEFKGCKDYASIKQDLSFYAYGYPSYKNKQKSNTVRIEGYITHIRDVQDESIDYKGVLYSMSESIETGFSGGPVTNVLHELIGMVVMGNEDKDISQYQNGFMSVKDIDEFLDDVNQLTSDVGCDN